MLEFEVKSPEEESVKNLDNVEPELDTDRNAMSGTWRTEPAENAGVRTGYVEMYFRTSRRLFVLKFPGHEDRIFNLHLPVNPVKSKYRNWSEWQNPDFVAKADQQPTRFRRKRLPDSIQGGLPAPIAAPKLSLEAHGLPLVRRK